MKALVLILSALAVCGTVLEPVCAQDLEFRLETSKPTYFGGEPVIFRTTYGSTGGPVQMKEPEYGSAWGKFVLDIRRDGEADWGKTETGWKPFIVCWPPSSELFESVFALPGSLKAGEKFQRVDMRGIKEGRYRTKAFLRNDDGSRHETNEVSFEVVPIEGKDCITGFVQGPELWSICGFVVGYHYTDGWEGSTTGMRPYLKTEEFYKLAPQVIEECTGSPFRELVLYAYIIGREQARHFPVELKEDPEVEALALQFLAEYPDSWLRPKIQKILFTTYRERKDTRAALQIGREMFSSELQPSELRAWRGEWERMEAEEASGGKAGH